jgi:glycosyltransferase involved in cell wall biosynthesis
MHVVALLATYNERRFIEPCLEHLREQGVDTYLIDNESTDDTVELAERRLGRGLIGIESFSRKDDVYNWRGLLARKEELARELDADWLIHLDADELRLPPSRGQSMAKALETADREGYNAVNFSEFTFVPTREAPDHDHPDFQRTMRSYYPFAPAATHQLKAWRRNDAVALAWSGGHQVRFPDLKRYPQSFPMKHYLFLSVPHAIEKYVERRYNPEEVEAGWHGWRASLTAADIHLPREAELRSTLSDDDLDPSRPRKKHYIEESAPPRALSS